MDLMRKYLNNTRKPKGFLGKVMVLGMNAGHSKVSLWGMEHLPPIAPDDMVDLGCGGGRTAARLMKKYPGASMTGVDYSEVSLAKARKLNRATVQSGRCQLVQGDVSHLNLPSDHYDLATAFETVYFWPGPLESFQQVFRILRSGGTFMIVNETDGTNPADNKWPELIEGMKIYSEKELLYWLTDAGFTDVQVHHQPEEHWICFVATKP